MLRKIRLAAALLFFTMITLLFLDFTGTVHGWFGWMAKIQFLPAVLALNVGVVIALVLLTLLLGRVYCSVICPLGVFQDIISWVSGKVKKNRFRYSPALSWLRYGVLAVFVVALVAAFSFNQLVLFFNVLFGKLGSGIMLVLMVLQLSASAGSYPIELSNEFFRAIHPWMPMTYSVHAFREAISIGGSVATDLTVLLSVGIVSMVLTWGVYHWKLRHNQMLWAA